MKKKDIVIIGGGPAGSTCASLLAREGFEVLVLEKEKFPRPHVGESLLPFCYYVLDDLGLLDEMKKRYSRKPGVQFLSPDGHGQTTYCFGHVIKDESYNSFHVMRCDFDKLLLDNSKKLGAEVMEETKVLDVTFLDDETVTVEIKENEGTISEINCNFLIDASGQNSFLANKFKWKQKHPKLDRIAFASHWTMGDMPNSLKEGLLKIVYLGGEKLGWIFVIPLSDNKVSVGVVVNQSYAQNQRLSLSKEGNKNWQEELYANEIETTPPVRNLLRNAKRVNDLMVVGDYSYLVSKKYGGNFALVGDSGTFLDPIFASGVYLSLQSASIISKSIIKSRKENKPIDLSPEYEKIQGAYNLVEKFIDFFYNPDAFNLSDIGDSTLTNHLQHDTAFSLVHYLLAGDFFTEYRKYDEFLTLLSNPSQFKKYKHLVLDQIDHKVESCSTEKISELFELMKK